MHQYTLSVRPMCLQCSSCQRKGAHYIVADVVASVSQEDRSGPDAGTAREVLSPTTRRTTWNNTVVMLQAHTA